jgi:RNA:NAD 2'-phosphotransferase (TPT1/KptA family)
MPQARPVIRRRYSVLVKRRGRASIKTWAWEIRHTPEQLAVQLEMDGFITAQAAKRAGEKALRTLLESLTGDKRNA